MTRQSETLDDPVLLEGEPSPRPARRPRRVVILLAGGLAAVLVVAGLGYRQWDARVETEFTEAVATFEAATAALAEAAAEGAEVLVSSDGRVSDEQVRAELATVLLAATSETTTVPTEGSRQDRTQILRATADDLRTHVDTVAAATSAVTAAVAAWELDQALTQYREALTQLRTVIDDGEHTLASTEGRVLDNAVREQLRTALDSAIGVRDSSVDESDSGALAAATAAATDTAEAVTDTAQDVLDAQVEWQTAESARIAAEQEAAAAAARSLTSSGSQSSSSRVEGRASSRPSAGVTGTSPESSGSPGGGTSSGDGSYWVEESTDACWVLDTAGNAWPC